MYRRRLEPTPHSFFLLGPRGTGKSTWLRATYPDAHVIDLLSEERYQRYLARPGAFADELRALAPGSTVVVDEVQRLPALLNEVQHFIEERRLRFVLCGSSARKLKQAGVNLLAGRALRRAMHPFLPEELGADFDLETALRWGTLPIVWQSPGRDETLAAYAQFYLKEEIQAEAIVRNLPGFARFLPIAALCHGQTVNVSNIARESGVARTTVGGYLEILEETLLCFRVPGFEGKLRVRERRLPKWYWCDPGLARAMRGTRGAPAAEERGALFEGFVAQLLRAYRDYNALCDSIAYWCPERRGAEVDFVLTRGDEHLAIEVKSGAQFSDRWCAGLRALAPLPNLRRRLIACPGGVRLRTEDGIDVLPLAELAAELAAGSLWDLARPAG
jgi:predicted AAA+ superfamily ATPase